MTRRHLWALFVLLCLLPSSAFAANEQVRSGVVIGFPGTLPGNGVGTVALSSAAGATGWNNVTTGDCLACSATGIAFSFVPKESKQISKFKVYASAEAGTVVAADMRAALWADSGAGVPNTGSAAVEEKTASADQTGAGWQEMTGFTATSTVTAGTQYWFVLRNANAAPTVNFPTYRFAQTNTTPTVINGATGTWGMVKTQTTDSGGTWSTGGNIIVPTGGWRIEFSDGTFMGQPIQNVAATTADYVYAAREAGVKWTTPSNATLNIKCLGFPLSRTGSTMGDLRFRLYSGSGTVVGSGLTLLATTTTIPQLNVATTTAFIHGCFATTQVVTGGTVLRVVWGNTTGGGSTTNALLQHTYPIDNTAGSKALFSVGGNAFMKTYTTDGTTFTDTDTDLFNFAVILDTNGEFTATSTSASGVIGG